MPLHYVTMLRKFQVRSIRDLLRTIIPTGKKRSWLYAGAIILIILFLALPLLTYRNFQQSSLGHGKTVKIFDFSTGCTMKNIAEELERSGIISSSLLFSLYSRLEGADSMVKASPYRRVIPFIRLPSCSIIGGSSKRDRS